MTDSVPYCCHPYLHKWTEIGMIRNPVARATTITESCEVCGEERRTRYSWSGRFYGRNLRVKEQIGTGTGTVNFGTGRKQTMRTLNYLLVAFVLAFVFVACSDSPSSPSDCGYFDTDAPSNFDLEVESELREGCQEACRGENVSGKGCPRLRRSRLEERRFGMLTGRLTGETLAQYCRHC